MTYNNSLHNDFMMDDHGLILQDTRVHNARYLLTHFIPDSRHMLKIEDSVRDVYYRPLAHLIPMSCFLAFGPHTFGYHIVNWLLLFLCALALYTLLNMLYKNPSLAFLTSLIFSVHPINGMMVNYITASVYGVQILAILSSLLMFVLAEQAVNPRQSIVFLVFSLFLFLVALLCHETSMVFPLYLFVMLLTCRNRTFSIAAQKSIPYFLLAAGYFVFRMYFASLKVSIIDKWAQFDISVLNYLATFSKIIIWYLQKLVTLDGIVLIWATSPVRQYVSMWILALLILIFLVGMMIKKWGRNDPRSLGVGWFAIGFLPVSFACLFQPTIGFMMEPHWVLFSTIGFFIWIAYALLLVREKWQKTIGTLVILTLLVSYMTVSRIYNRLWADEKKYCQYWLGEVPGFKSVMFYQASAYMREGDFPKAREVFYKAIAHQHSDFEIYTNLGLIDLSFGHLPEAIQNFETALTIYPNSAVTYTNLGAAYLKLNDLKKAQAFYQKAIALNPFLVESKLNLAKVYEVLGKTEEAGRLLEESFKIDPSDERVVFELARYDWQRGNKPRAISLNKKLLFTSQDAKRLTNLGSLAAQNGYVDLAFVLFNRAINLDPQFPDAYLEAGKLYGNLDQFNRAIAMWQEGWKVAPSDDRFKDLILQAQALLERP